MSTLPSSARPSGASCYKKVHFILAYSNPYVQRIMTLFEYICNMQPTRKHGFGCPLGMYMKNICFFARHLLVHAMLEMGPYEKYMFFRKYIRSKKHMFFEKVYMFFEKVYVF